MKQIITLILTVGLILAMFSVLIFNDAYKTTETSEKNVNTFLNRKNVPDRR